MSYELSHPQPGNCSGMDGYSHSPIFPHSDLLFNLQKALLSVKSILGCELDWLFCELLDSLGLLCDLLTHFLEI